MMIPGVSVLWNYLIYFAIAVVTIFAIIMIAVGVTRYFCKPTAKELAGGKVMPEPSDSQTDKSVNSTSVTEIEQLHKQQKRQLD